MSAAAIQPGEMTEADRETLDFMLSMREVFGEYQFRVTTNRFIAVSPGINPHGGPLGEGPRRNQQSVPETRRAAAALGREYVRGQEKKTRP